MKTVLFIDKNEGELWDTYLSHSYLLDEWLQRGDVAFCGWHRDALSARAAVPDLANVLDGEQDWEAVVVCDLRCKGNVLPQADESYGNPFDFPENYDVSMSSPLEESQRPIIRLTQMLGGIPDRVALLPLSPLAEDSGAGCYTRANEFELRHPRSEEYFDLLARYRLGLPRPRRIACITPRIVDHDLEHEMVADDGILGRRHAERFWERNAYAPGTRFIVVDFAAQAADAMSEADRLIYEQQWFDFWCSVITFSLNDFSSNDLAAYRLYRLSVELDGKEMRRHASRRAAVWSAASDMIEAREAQEKALMRRSEFVEPELPDCTTIVNVEFDVGTDGRQSCDSSGVGLFRDVPQDDMAVWSDQYREVVDTFRELLWAPRRGVRNAALRYRSQHTLAPEELEYCILNQYEQERLEDEQRVDEMRLASSVSQPPFVFDSYEQRIENQATETVTSIRRRSSAAINMIVVFEAVMMMAVGLAIGAVGGGMSTRGQVLAVMAVATGCLVVFAVGMITLVLQKMGVRASYRAFNIFMNGIREGMRSEGERVASRISTYATMQKRWQIIDRQAARNLPTRRLSWLRERHAKISEQRENLERLVGEYCPSDRETYRLTLARGWEDMARSMDEESFFSLQAFSPVKRPFNANLLHGGHATVPFAFVSEVSLVPLSLASYYTDGNREGGLPC